jgi:hypothetical protein
VLAKFLRSLEKRVSGEKAPFVYPVPPAPRTAVLVQWFAASPLDSLSPWISNPVDEALRRAKLPGNITLASSTRIFREGWGVEAAKYEPAAIAATHRQFQDLMGWRIPSLTHAVIVLSRPEERRLREEERERLWRAFGVPVFEQIIGVHGELLAAECEAHDGLHVESPFPQLDDEALCDTRCPCGRTTPRIGVVEGVEAERRLAAYAR